MASFDLLALLAEDCAASNSGVRRAHGPEIRQGLSAEASFSCSLTGGNGCPVSSRVFMLFKIQIQPSLTFCQVSGLCSRLPWTSRTRVSPSPARSTVHSTRLAGSSARSGS